MAIYINGGRERGIDAWPMAMYNLDHPNPDMYDYFPGMSNCIVHDIKA